jgi:hypothetical protein
MKIENHRIEEFTHFLLSLRLKGSDNRMRNRLVKILQNQLKILQEEHKELLNEYCKKDGNGEFITIQKNGTSFYDIDDVKGFQVEFQILMEENLHIPMDANNQAMLKAVRDVVVNCDLEFSGTDALNYEYYCEILEDTEIVSI